MQLLTSRSAHTHQDDDEEGSLCAGNSGMDLMTFKSQNYHILKEQILIFDFIFPCSDLLERNYLRPVHNCVYFAVKVLENQFQ